VRQRSTLPQVGRAPLSQFGSFHELTAITSDEWGEGIHERLARDQTSITNDALSRLVELGERHPRTTMLIAQQALAQAIEDLFREIDHAIVVAALGRAMASEQLRHQWYVIDPVLRRHLAGRRVELLSFIRNAFDVVRVSDRASVSIDPGHRDEPDVSGSPGESTTGR
jgi:hypothetical protein